MVSLRSFVAAVALIAAPAMAAVTPAQLADTIKMMTTKSRALYNEPANSISKDNAPLMIIGEGPLAILIREFTSIVTTATDLISQLDGTPPIQPGPDSALIFDTFREFARVNIDVFNTMGRTGLAAKFLLAGDPVAAVLRRVEGVVDTLAAKLIKLVESRAADLGAEHQSLKKSLELCIENYKDLAEAVFGTPP